MMRFAISLVCWLVVISGIHSQEYWSTVPAPKSAPVVQQRGAAQDSDYTWKYPFNRPTPAGVIRVSNTIVDANGKLGKWSAARELTVKSGWRLWGGSWNLPVIEDCSGVAWKLEIVSVDPKDDWKYNPYKPGAVKYLYTNWNGSYLQNETSPVSGFSPYLQQLTEDAVSYYALEKFSTGGTFQQDTSAPVVIPYSIPNKTYELAYCRVTETGETALSPAYLYTPSPLDPGVFPAEASNLRCFIYEYHPQGTIGLHFYRRELITPEKPATETTAAVPAVWGAWKRLPSPELYGDPSKDEQGNLNNPDDWLFPIWQRAIHLIRYIEDSPTHQPVQNPQSRLSDLHRLLRGDAVRDKEVLEKYGLPTDKLFVGDVIVKSGDYFQVYCPIIDEWGNGDTGTTGAPPDQKFRRKIRSEDGEVWNIAQRTSQSGHKSWPVLVVHNSYSEWHDVAITAHGGDGIVPSDYSGGQAFGNKWYRCLVTAPMSPGGRVTCGVRFDARCAPSHHPSEQLFSDCYISGGIAILNGGIQSANVRYDRLHAGSNAPDGRGSVFYIENPNPLKFLNGCFCDAYINGVPGTGVIFRTNVYQATLQVSDIWVDAGFRRFIESNNAPTQLAITDGKLNVRGDKPVLGLIVGNPRSKSTWLMQSVQVQRDPGTQPPRIISHSYRLAEPLYERTGLADLVLKTPSTETATAMIKRFGGNLTPMEETGYRQITELPVTVVRPRTQAEINEAYIPLSRIKSLPAWGKTFFRDHYLKNVTETKTVELKRYFNSLTTSAKVVQENIDP